MTADEESEVTAEPRWRSRPAFGTGRWDGVTGVALALVGVGVVARQPGLVVLGAVGVGYGSTDGSARHRRRRSR